MNMEKTELIDYFEKIKKLEFAIYTHETLKPIYLQKLQSQQPTRPTLKKCSPIEKPMPPEKPAGIGGTILGVLIFMVFPVIFLILGIIVEMPIVIIFSILFGCFMFFLVCPGLRDTIDANNSYESNLTKYNRQLREYEETLISNKELTAQYKTEFQQQMEVYNKNLSNINSKIFNIQKEFNTISFDLQNTLETLYSQNVIFPKYRNLIAISSILEYLSSGRCSELEGPNGAYNLYESELRQNIIISQLSSITRNLEQIKNNQYILYQELNNSNRIIRDMLENIGNEISISNYHAQINTIALTSPKVSCGIIL